MRKLLVPCTKIVTAVVTASLLLTGIAHATPPPVHVISDCNELQQIDQDVSSYADTFLLANDIDCSGAVFTTFFWGQNAFGGTFDGQGHTISNFSVYPYYSNGGLFSDTLGATIKNLTLSSATVQGGSGYIGALVGQAIDTTIDNVHSDVTVIGGSVTGGLVGDVTTQSHDASITRSSATGSVTGAYGVGGLVGHISNTDHTVTVSQSFSSGYVSNSANYTGGLIGLIENNAVSAATNTMVEDDYSTSYADGTTNYDSGGLLGGYYANANGTDAANLTIARVYASGDVDGSSFTGGLIGDVGQIPANSRVNLTDVFAANQVGSGDLPHSGAIVGHQDITGAGGAITASGVYYDQSQSLFTTCAGTASTELTGCHPQNAGGTTPNYFSGNHSSAPLNNWNFTAIWHVLPGNYPVFQVTPANGQDDSDGITTAVENAAPNNGDANNDGTADSQQSNVASFVDSQTGKYVSAETSNACTLSDVADSTALANSTSDARYTYPDGFIGYTAHCGTPGYTATIKLYIYGAADNLVLRKYNPTTHVYSSVSGATVAPVTVGGQAAQLVTYQVTDGSSLDDDGLANGVIVDPVGLGAPLATAASSVTSSPSVAAPNTGLARRTVFLPLLSLFGGAAVVSLIGYRRLKVREIIV